MGFNFIFIIHGFIFRRIIIFKILDINTYIKSEQVEWASANEIMGVSEQDTSTRRKMAWWHANILIPYFRYPLIDDIACSNEPCCPHFKSVCWSSPLTEFTLKFPPPTYEERIIDTILCSSLEILESREGKMEKNWDNWGEVQNVINESS